MCSQWMNEPINEWRAVWSHHFIDEKTVNRWNELCGHEQSQAWKQFLFGTRSPAFTWGGLPRRRAVGGSCFSEIGLIFACSRESMWHVILSRLRGILRRTQDSFGPGPFRSGQSEGGNRSWWLKAHTLQPESESWLFPLLVVRLWVDHFTLRLTHKIYFKVLERRLHELMYVLRIVPGRLVLYMCQYYYYEKFELIGKRG